MGTAEPIVVTTSAVQSHKIETASGAPVETESAGSGNIYTVKSPIVGTFYRAPSPQSAAFINPGDSVIEGQTLCLIEAMKLMNEIKAERGGKVSKIMVENGMPVEFDQPLIEIVPVSEGA